MIQGNESQGNEFRGNGYQRYVLGVTGSMGCGKSYACERLIEIAKSKSISVSYYNVDLIRRDMLGVNQEYFFVRNQLKEQFGKDILNSDSSIDSLRINDIIYYDSQKMKEYKSIVNPCIEDYLKKDISTASGIALVEWAMLAEDGLLAMVDYNTLVVSCDSETQLDRHKDGDLPMNQIKKRICNQLSNTEKISQICKMQQEQGFGDLFLFDTSHNPGPEDYLMLFDKISAVLR
ncbi:MAG: dephospho-CoA kinase [Nanoarchaeota archaeon]|nr:dephospho-CoA kinase [Nanoarchaeota archaeon]